ncbi:MAG TPA: 2Fe-2S iron-sulfur cluster-binding protein [Promicromonospora sp.]|nr:2Fe-2S iron-sulfur cluster-binding protein [Promicromonospora sp.]
MARIVYVSRDQEPVTVEAVRDETVMSLARMNGVRGIIGRCGGFASCGTCHVYLDEGVGEFPARTEIEEDVLADVPAPVRENSRLACQLEVGPATGDVQVVVAFPQ